MHFVVYCLDHPGVAERRLAHYDEHRAWRQASPLNTLISGPLTDFEGTAIGSFSLYEADDIEAVRRFVQDDPFNKAGVWNTVDIRPFLKRVDNRSPV
jgi:uncharacterized protein